MNKEVESDNNNDKRYHRRRILLRRFSRRWPHAEIVADIDNFGFLNENNPDAQNT